MKRVKVYLWDNDPIKQHYNVGTYEVYGYIIPYELYVDSLIAAREHDVYFGCGPVIDAFVDCLIDGIGQAISIDCSMFLQVEVIDGE